jgi:hypothetical protein
MMTGGRTLVFGLAGLKLPPEAVVLKCSFPPGRPKERK